MSKFCFLTFANESYFFACEHLQKGQFCVPKDGWVFLFTKSPATDL